jgi:hypothetical protein
MEGYAEILNGVRGVQRVPLGPPITVAVSKKWNMRKEQRMPSGRSQKVSGCERHSIFQIAENVIVGRLF